MVEALDHAMQHNDVLVRYAGQWWAREGADTDAGRPTVECFPNRTIMALMRRGWLKVVQTATSRHCRIPVKVSVIRRWPLST